MAHMVSKLTAGRPMGAAPAIQQVAAKQAAAPAPRAAAPAAAVQQTAKRYSGAYSGALNSNADAENRAHAVAARRQADADKYAAFVMGQQGAVAAAAHRQDQQTLALDGATQAATLNSQLKLQAGLGAGRQQQGITGPVPLQQSAGLVNDQQAGQALMGAVTQQQADKTNTNAGKAAFLQAAAQASLLANKRAIAGDEYNQVSDIQRERTGLLTTRTESAQADKRAAASAAADAANAQLAHEDRLAALDNSKSIANDNRQAASDNLNTRLDAAATQGHRNRVVRLKTAAVTAAAGGYVNPKEQQRRNQAVSASGTSIANGKASAKQLVDLSKLPPVPGSAPVKLTPELVRHRLLKDNPKMPREEQDYIIAAAFGRKAGVTKKGQPSAARRYSEYLNKLKTGQL